MAYVIGCQTSGGLTGFRQSHLKKDGRVLVFETRAAAEAALPESRSLSTGADLKYWVEEDE